MERPARAQDQAQVNVLGRGDETFVKHDPYL
jgi:hypothetical protein